MEFYYLHVQACILIIYLATITALRSKKNIVIDRKNEHDYHKFAKKIVTSKRFRYKNAQMYL